MVHLVLLAQGKINPRFFLRMKAIKSSFSLVAVVLVVDVKMSTHDYYMFEWLR